MYRSVATLTLLLSIAGCAIAPIAQDPQVSFVELMPNGSVARELRFSLTQNPVETCISGDWREARPLNDHGRYTKRPAYVREGDNLEVLLVNTVCDGYDSYVGKVTRGRFAGEHVQYGLGFSKSLGTVSGSLSVP